MLERGHAGLEAPSRVVECYIQSVLLLLPPQSLPQAQEKGFLQVLGADDMPGPGLMLGAWCQVGDDHLDSLQFLILGRDRAHLIGDLVAFHWNIFPFHTAGEKERSSELRRWLPPESAYLVSLQFGFAEPWKRASTSITAEAATQPFSNSGF